MSSRYTSDELRRIARDTDASDAAREMAVELLKSRDEADYLTYSEEVETVMKRLIEDYDLLNEGIKSDVRYDGAINVRLSPDDERTFMEVYELVEQVVDEEFGDRVTFDARFLSSRCVKFQFNT